MGTQSIDTFQSAQIAALETDVAELRTKLNLAVTDAIAISTKLNILIDDLNDMNVFRGVISSLVKKGIIIVEEEDKCFGENQSEIIINRDFYKENEEGYFVLTNLEVK